MLSYLQITTQIRVQSVQTDHTALTYNIINNKSQLLNKKLEELNSVSDSVYILDCRCSSLKKQSFPVNLNDLHQKS